MSITRRIFIRSNVLMIILLTLIACTLPIKKKLHIYLVGDSTMCTYEIFRAPLTGWGMPFSLFFDSTASIENRARGGRSTRTFLNENRWKPIADSLQDGDFVFIQFGHNDEAKEEKYKDHYTPVHDYKSNLVRFITDSRSKKAIPVLITPVTRMRFDKDGRIMETHKEYTAAVHEIALQHKVPLIDLDKASRELLQKFGPEHSKLLFMQLEPGEHPNYPEGQKDNTHFNEFGARKIAELVLAGILELRLGLKDRVVSSTAR